MLKLFLIRHGETDFNVKGIVQGGGVDSDLNEKGLQQGRAFFEAYKHIPFEKIYCSGLKRTYQTIHFFEQEGYEIARHEGVNEFNWGDLEGREADAETKRWFREITAAWEKGELEVGIPNGETPISAWKRCEPFFQYLFETHKEGNILICTHGRTLRIILSQLLGDGMENMHIYHHDNTGVNVLLVNQNGQIEVEVLNDLGHLEGRDLEVTKVDYRN